MTTTTQEIKPVLLSENTQAKQSIERDIATAQIRLNASQSAYKALGFTGGIPIEHALNTEYRTAFFRSDKVAEVIRTSVKPESFNYPSEVGTIEENAAVLNDLRPEFLGCLTYDEATGKFIRDIESLERLIDTRCRKFTSDPRVIQALMLAERAAAALNIYFDFVDSGVNGEFSERPDLFNGQYKSFKVETVATVNGLRQRLAVNKDEFTNDGYMPSGIMGLLRLKK